MTTNKTKIGGNDSYFHDLSSTNPGNPVILTADVEVLDGYTPDDASFYYKTLAITSNYGVVWLRPITADNYDLYIYTDSGYSTLLDSSAVGGVGGIEWVVIKRGAETDYYPRVWVPIGNIGNGYIEYDTALACARGESKSNDHLSSTDAIEAYYLYLTDSRLYDLHLGVPSTGDFDLYLYYLESSMSADPTEYLSASTTVGLGVDESITSYTPPQAGTYVALIVWRSGDGSFQFLFDFAEQGDGGIPGFGALALILALVAVVVVKRRLISPRSKSF